MMTNDPVGILKAVINKAELGDSLSNLLASVRKIEESDRNTLERLIKERSYIVELLTSNSRTKHLHADFDFGYKANFKEAVDKLLERLSS
jgi:hypothetical protein